jgi:hypothetical protein
MGHDPRAMIRLSQRSFNEAPAGPGAFLLALTVLHRQAIMFFSAAARYIASFDTRYAFRGEVLFGLHMKELLRDHRQLLQHGVLNKMGSTVSFAY